VILVPRTFQPLARRLKAEATGRIDLRNPAHLAEWGGPLNGQLGRQWLVAQLAAAKTFDLVVETGAYRGATTAFLAATFDCRVFAFEKTPRYYVYVRRRLRRNHLVTVELGDSRDRLEALASRQSGRALFAYLDAHWNRDLPLRGELQIIDAHWSTAVVMVDDFHVPQDAGYAFDDYGEDARLDREYVRRTNLEGWTISFPTLRSDRETGRRRGCCVLFSPGSEIALPELTPPQAI
jgi:hypothetical protein